MIAYHICRVLFYADCDKFSSKEFFNFLFCLALEAIEYSINCSLVIQTLAPGLNTNGNFHVSCSKPVRTNQRGIICDTVYIQMFAHFAAENMIKNLYHMEIRRPSKKNSVLYC